jgi:hypothetical protein
MDFLDEEDVKPLEGGGKRKKFSPLIGNANDKDQGAQTPPLVMGQIYSMFDHPSKVRDVCPIDHPVTGWDAFVEPWGERAYCNPPYDNMGEWVARALQQRAEGCSSIVLSPVRTQTLWWTESVMHADHIAYIQTGIRFTDSRSGKPYAKKSPFPLALIFFNAGALRIPTTTVGTSSWEPMAH